MAEFAIVDSHVHLWDPKHLRYDWLESQPSLNRAFLPEDFTSAILGLPVTHLVFIQADCARSLSFEEFEWVGALAEKDRRIAGIVAYAPLEEGEGAKEHLDRLARHPKHCLLRGIRRLIQSEREKGFCIQPGFIKGVQLLATYDLTFDLCVTHDQLDDVVDLVRACPQVRFVLDHIGKPDIKGRILEPWRKQISTLAALPNVLCKISGLVTEADPFLWQKEDLRPYIDHVLDRFGFDRVMFGSDWPVERLASDYPRWVAAVQWATQGASAQQMHNLFVKNAKRFYKIEI